MPIELEVESIEKVDEKYRPFYEEHDGKFVLEDALADLVTTKKNFSTIVDKERKSARNLRSQVEAWTALGESPEAIQKKVRQLEAAVSGSDEAKAQEIERIKAEIIAARDKEIEALQGKISKADHAVQRYLVEAAAKAAIADAGGSVDVLLPHVISQLKVLEVGDSLEVRLTDPKDPKADYRYNARGEPMTPQELVLELREQETFKPLFKADDRSGGGTQPGSLGGGGGVTRLTKAEWTDKVGRAKPDERKKLMQDLSAGKYRVTD